MEFRRAGANEAALLLNLIHGEAEIRDFMGCLKP